MMSYFLMCLCIFDHVLIIYFEKNILGSFLSGKLFIYFCWDLRILPANSNLRFLELSVYLKHKLQYPKRAGLFLFHPLIEAL